MIAHLFRSGEPETRIDDTADLPRELGRHELLWVDAERGEDDVQPVMEALGVDSAAERLAEEATKPALARIDDVVLITVLGLSTDDTSSTTLRPARVDLVARGNVLLTVRDARVAGLGDLVELIEGRSEIGTLDAATFVAVLIDGLLGAYFAATEDIERAVDELDDRALRARPDQSFVHELVPLRRRIAALRRSLVPHRDLVAALAQPDLGIAPSERDPWTPLLARLERAVDAVENARELLLGSFDLDMSRTAQRTNDIVRVLTVVSVTLLPAGVLAGIFGMNFPAPVFESGGTFFVAVGLIVAVSAAILLVALLRRWL